MTLLRCEVVVVGGGPAGALAARALALSGRDVALCEASAFPRSHVGVCLNAGAARMLSEVGLPHLLQSDAHRPVKLSRRTWERPETDEAPRSDLICDRGVLDQALLAAAAEAGVRVLQPVRVRDRIEGDRWKLHVSGASDITIVEAAFLLEASGRRQAARRHRLAPPTLALSSRWRGSGDAIGLAALDRSWVWTAPGADGQTFVLVTIGSNDPDLANATISDVHSRLARASGLLTSKHEPAGAVVAIDATPYDCFAADRTSLRIGEAALGLDPLSSSGLSAAIQSALAGAVVADTLLDGGGDHEAALEYAKDNHTRRRQVHTARTCEAYAAVAPRFGSSFWTERSSSPERTPQSKPIPPLPGTATHLELAAALRLVDAPCIRGNRIERFPAIEMAGSNDPLAFVEGIAIAPLIRSVAGPQTAESIVRNWSIQVGSHSAIRILSWAWQNRLLVAITDD